MSIYQLTHSFAFRLTGVLCRLPVWQLGTEAFFRHLGVAVETARSGRHTKSHEAAKGTLNPWNPWPDSVQGWFYYFLDCPHLVFFHDANAGAWDSSWLVRQKCNEVPYFVVKFVRLSCMLKFLISLFCWRQWCHVYKIYCMTVCVFWICGEAVRSSRPSRVLLTCHREREEIFGYVWCSVARVVRLIVGWWAM